MKNQDLLYEMPEDMLALANSVCLLAIVVVWYVRKRKHCKARHSTARGHAVDLAKLNGAGDTTVCLFVLSTIRSWVWYEKRYLTRTC